MGRRWGIIPTRGVYQGLAFSGALTSGSSPLARGLPGAGDRGPPPRWIIPARAGFTRREGAEGREGGDHPRSRGVYDPNAAIFAQSSGSSPLARGLRQDRDDAPVARRIIPARAGFTSGGTCRRCNGRDHPRSRGVYAAETAATAMTQGSSPLARGLLADDGAGGGVVRIIPARAGFTCAPPPSRRPRGDHPRSRGVYDSVSVISVGGEGSSPLARGLPAEHLRRDGPERIIPARAGFT